MKIIHFSDTHLGFSDFSKIDPELGINLREADVYRAFSQVVDYIISTQPDIVIHSGDLFDTYRPSNRAINLALKEIAKISQKNIPFVMISGNHSTPRIKTSGSIFEAFEVFNNVYPVYQSKYQELIINDAALHCVPHMATEEELSKVFDDLKPNAKKKYNIIVAHLGVTADVQYKMGEFNELIIPQGVLKKKKDFNYIALGHYHKNLPLADNCYYSGSTECFSFNEAGQKKGFMDINLAQNTKQFIPLKTREMLAFQPINCKDLSISEIIDKAENLVRGQTKGNLLQVTFDNINKHQYTELDLQKLKEITKDAVHLKTVYNWIIEKGKAATKTAIGTLTSEFENFIEYQNIKDLNKNKLKKLGISYLSSAQEAGEE